MDLGQIRSLVACPAYDFLRDDYRLGKNIILLTVVGSHAYGTNHNGSDLDIRGAATNDRFSILTMQDFEHVRHSETDTIIYCAFSSRSQASDMTCGTITLRRMLQKLCGMYERFRTSTLAIQRNQCGSSL